MPLNVYLNVSRPNYSVKDTTYYYYNTEHLDLSITCALKTELTDAAAVWVDGATNQDSAT